MSDAAVEVGVVGNRDVIALADSVLVLDAGGVVRGDVDLFTGRVAAVVVWVSVFFVVAGLWI